MRFSNISRVGRQVLRSVLLVSGLTLAMIAVGCGPAAQEAVIDQSVPAADPAAMGADPASMLNEAPAAAPEAATDAAPAATTEAAPESGQ